MSIEDASIKVNKTLGGATAGCGSAHRIAPIAACENITTNELVYYARKEAESSTTILIQKITLQLWHFFADIFLKDIHGKKVKT